jgi:predicted Zn-dependent peptidase
VSVRKNVQLPGVVLAYHAPAAREREAKVLNVAEYVLFHGRSSRLYQRLIYRDQIATEVAGGIHFRIDPSTFTVRATARPEVAIERVRDAILEELARLAKVPVSPEELEKAKRAIEAEFVFAQESHHELAQNLGAAAARGSWREFATYLEDHQTVTEAEIMAAARETFRETNRTVGYLVPDASPPLPEEPDAESPAEVRSGEDGSPAGQEAAP